MYVLLAVITGGLISIMIVANGELQITVGAIPALILIHLSGLATTLSFIGGRRVARRPRAPSWRGAMGVPVWFAIAGTLGVGIVFMSNEVFRRGGVLLTLMGTLAGQTLAAQLLEFTQQFGQHRSPALQRTLTMVLVVPGAAIIGLASGVGILWVLLSWIPGMVLMLQAMMNSRIAHHKGSGFMLFLNYATALTALAVVVSLHPAFLRGACAVVFRTPVLILVGGGIIGVLVVGFSSYLLNRTSALRTVMGMYTGQIAVGILLDLARGLPLQIEKLAGVALVLIGLFAGETSIRRGGRKST